LFYISTLECLSDLPYRKNSHSMKDFAYSEDFCAPILHDNFLASVFHSISYQYLRSLANLYSIFLVQIFFDHNSVEIKDR